MSGAAADKSCSSVWTGAALLVHSAVAAVRLLGSPMPLVGFSEALLVLWEPFKYNQTLMLVGIDLHA